MNSKRPQSRHIISKLSKDIHGEYLESSKRKVTRYVQGGTHKIINRYLTREEQDNIFEVLKERKLSTKNNVSGKTILPK